MAVATRASPSMKEEEELQQLQRINSVVRRVCQGMEQAQGNLALLQRTVGEAEGLLDTWIRILSGAEHTQRLLLDGRWQGVEQDVEQEVEVRAEPEPAATPPRREKEKEKVAIKKRLRKAKP